MGEAAERELIQRTIAAHPHGATARRVAAYGVERELDIWRLSRAMATVHAIDLRRWTHRDPHFVELVKAARHDLWRAYLAGYLSGVDLGGDDDAQPGDR